MIKVLIAEDSAAQRELLAYVLAQDPALSIVALAKNGREAVELTRAHRPHVIVMDVHMPLMNGYEATREILAEVPTPIVMVSASMASSEIDLSFEALRAGALTIMDKPPGLDDPGHDEAVSRLVTAIKLLSEVKVVRRWRPDTLAAKEVPPKPAESEGRRARVVAIGASTGGPRVIADILEGMAKTFRATILIVQHMPPGFITGFAGWLGGKVGLEVRVAEPDAPLRPSTVLLAPDGWQMGVSRTGRVALRPGRPGDAFCPSVSYLLGSVAESYGRDAAGVLLTGMGRDGADGLLRLRQAGGLTIAQDAESCVVFGMPKEAIALDAAEHVLPPDHIGAVLRSITQ